MGRSQKWPDLRTPISKIRDIRFVGTDELIIFWKFHNFPWNIVAVARLESYFVVGSLDLTWWPDLIWHWVEIFTKVAEKMGGKVGENPAALRDAVFSLSSKNLRGGRSNNPPVGRGLTSPSRSPVASLRISASVCSQIWPARTPRHTLVLSPDRYASQGRWQGRSADYTKYRAAGHPPVLGGDSAKVPICLLCMGETLEVPLGSQTFMGAST